MLIENIFKREMPRKWGKAKNGMMNEFGHFPFNESSRENVLKFETYYYSTNNYIIF